MDTFDIPLNLWMVSCYYMRFQGLKLQNAIFVPLDGEAFQ